MHATPEYTYPTRTISTVPAALAPTSRQLAPPSLGGYRFRFFFLFGRAAAAERDDKGAGKSESPLTPAVRALDGAHGDARRAQSGDG